MHLNTDQEILEAVSAVLGNAGNSLDTSLHRDLLLNALKCKRDGLSTLDLKVINRSIAEFRHACAVFGPYRDVRKVSIFGSARTPIAHPAYAMAADLGAALARAGHMVITGAASGIMRAGIDGAGPTNSFGVNITLPFEQLNAADFHPQFKLVRFKYFFMRKVFFVMEADAFALFPGGFGTHDEAFEVLTLLQTGKTPPHPVVLVDPPGETYWEAWDRFVRDHLLARGYISPEDTSLYRIVNSTDEAVAAIRHFYSTYHSLRNVGDLTVLRLEQALTPPQVMRLNRDFRDLLTQGDIEQRGPLPEEAGEPELADKPRLVLHVAHGRAARLHQLIHAINDMGATLVRREVRPGAAPNRAIA